MALSLRDIGFRLGFDLDKQSEAEVENSIKGLKNIATKLLGAVGVGFSLTQINALAEEFNGINDKISYAVKGLADEKETQQAILKAANETKASYASMADIVSDLVKSNTELFPIDDAIAFSSTVTKLMKIAGRSEQETQSMMDGLNKSFQKGIVDTETLNIMLEQCPEAANLLADSLGVAKTQLLELASNGQISVTQLKDAFLNASDEIDIEFQNLDYSLSDATQNIRNKWGFFVDDLNTTYKITQTIAKAITKLSDVAVAAAQKIRNRIDWISDKLGGAEKLTRLVTIAASALFAVILAQNAKKVIAFISNWISKLGFLNKKTIALIAVIVILALLVEDFIAFMKGEDSLFGTLLKNAGVDVEKLRENIVTVWENIKQVLPAIWQGIKNVGIPIFQALWKAIKTIFKAIGTVIEAVLPIFADLLEKLANGDVDTASWEKFGETIGTIVAYIAGFVLAIKSIVAVVKVVIAISKAWTVIQGIVNAVMSASPIIWLVAAIIALIVIIVLLITHWDSVKAAMQAVWDKIVEVFSGVANWFKANVIDPIVNFFTNLWNSITSIISRIKESIVDGLTVAIDWIKNLPSQALQWGKDIIMGIVDGIKSAIGAVSDAVKSVAAKIKSNLGFSEPEEGPLSDFHTYMPDMIDLMTQGITAGKQSVSKAVKGVAEQIENTLGFSEPEEGPLSDFHTYMPDMIDLMTQGIIVGKQSVGNAVKGVTDKIKNNLFSSEPKESTSPSSNTHTSGTTDLTAQEALAAMQLVSDSLRGIIDKIKAIITFLTTDKSSTPDLSDDDNNEKNDDNQDNDNEPKTSRLHNSIVNMLQKIPDVVKSSGNDISNTFSALISDISLLAKSNIVDELTAANITNNSNISKWVNQNVNISNTFNGERTGQYKSSEAMKSASEDATSQMARALIFAR